MESNQKIPTFPEPLGTYPDDSPLSDTDEETNTEGPFTTCTYKQEAYDPGAIVCMGGNKMKCKNDGQWTNIGSC